MICLLKPHTCGKCGLEHWTIPANAKVLNVGDDLDGFYFECNGVYPSRYDDVCGSTLFIPMKVLGDRGNERKAV